MAKRLNIKSMPHAVRQINAMSTMYSNNLKISYGIVVAINEDFGTCDIELNNGFTIKNIHILSKGFPLLDPVSGGITYPPVDSNVIVLFPENDMKNGFILPAPLDYTNDDVKSEILTGGNVEIIPPGYKIEYDAETGNLTITDIETGNEDFTLFIDRDNKEVTVSDWHGNNVVLNSSGIAIEDTNGNTIETSTTKVDINSGNLEVLM